MTGPATGVLESVPPVWAGVVGQPGAVRELARAAGDAAEIVDGRRGPAMTHAWLVTGPPGSGRSTAARAFAAALQCPQEGCGQCVSCHQALTGHHPDVTAFSPERLQITAEESLGLIRQAAMSPGQGRWNVLVVEDADRLNDVSGNALLKSLEEPGARTVWVLCAPTAEDVLPTIASRTRHVRLRTPTAVEVRDALVARDGLDPAIAAFAARAAQGHIGRARALAGDEAVRQRRAEVLAIPGSLGTLAACFIAAQNLLDAATADAGAITDALDAQEVASLRREFGDGGTGALAAAVRRASTAAVKALEGGQRSRRTRTIRDQVDRALLDLTGLYRDVLVVQVGTPVELINDELRPTIESMAVHSSVAATSARLTALERARLQVSMSVAPLLALEALMVSLARGRPA